MKLNYLHRFFIELICGLIMSTSILLFGTKGEVALVLLIIIPILGLFKKMKPDERELALFHKINSLSIISGLLIFFLLFLFSIYTTNELLKLNWWRISIATAIILHGGIGIYFLKYK